MANKKFSKTVILVLTMTLMGCSMPSWLQGCRHKEEEGSFDIVEEKEKEQRLITVINGTDLTINELSITAGEGVEVVTVTDPKLLDAKSYTKEIEEKFDNYDTFNITLIDVYELHYEKTITIEEETGNYDVKITQNDYVEYPGDWQRKLNKMANGD